MKIQKIQSANYSKHYTSYTPNFQRKTDNLQNRDIFTPARKEKQKIPLNLYFVRMKCYGKNLFWANDMKKLTYNIAQMIKSKNNFNEVLIEAEKGVANINQNVAKTGGDNFAKRRDTEGFYAVRGYSRGLEYKERYNKKFNQNLSAKNNDLIFCPKSNSTYKDANLCKIHYDDWGEDYGFSIQYGYSKKNKLSNLDLVKNEYEKLIKLENPAIKTLHESCATIQWLIMQECPYLRGNDSIANLLTKSIYLAHDIQPARVKKGYSTDFEAFSSNLDDYIKNYPFFFEQY